MSKNVTVNQFFSDLYHGCSEGCITITTLPDRHNYHVPVTEMDKAVSLAEKLGRRTSTYYNVALRKSGLNEYTRGDENELSTVVCMCADVDVKGGAHKQKALPETTEEALDFVKSLPFRPSYIIKSGNGIHAIWLLDKPYVIRTPDDLEKISAVSTGFGAYLLREGQKHGWVIDSVQDLPRMLRCPGTLNFKTDPPKECHVLNRNADEDGSLIRYSVDTFIPYKAETEGSAPVEMGRGDIGPAERMENNCAFIDYCINNADSLSEPWWHAFLSIVALTEDGFSRGHEWSEPYSGYSFDETEERLKRSLKAHKPCSCRYIRNNIGFNCPEGGCENCGRIVGSPIVFSYYTQDEHVQKLIDEDLSLEEAVSEHNLLLVSYAKEHLPARYILLKKKYQKLKISSRELDMAVRAAQEKKARSTAQQDFFGELLLDGIDTGGLNIPEGWDLSMKGISHMEMSGAGSFIRHITLSPVLITKRLENLEDGSVKLELAFHTGHIWKYITLPRGDVMDKGKLIKSADVGLPVASNNAADLVKFLSLFEAVNMEKIRSVRAIDHLGWVNGMKEFYPFRMKGEVAFDGQGSEAGKVVNAIHESGSKEKWLDMRSGVKEGDVTDDRFYREILGAGAVRSGDCAHHMAGETGEMQKEGIQGFK